MTFYGSVAGFKSYHSARNHTVPATWTDAYIESSLLVATEWLDGKYGDVFTGCKTGGFLQEREWPRESAVTNTYPSYVFPTDVIPDQVVNATYEAAFREATTTGSLIVDYTPNIYKTVGVDGAVSVEYDKSLIQANDFQVQIPIIEQLLKPLFYENLQSGFSGKAQRV